jgi:hypothetical protein
MREENPELNKYRLLKGTYGTDETDGTMGMFILPGKGIELTVLSSGPSWGIEGIRGWEHVSVSTPRRTPNWDEMNMVKDLFWADDETVIQYHPKKTEYKNLHPYCLHLWKKGGVEWELPPSIAVAP